MSPSIASLTLLADRPDLATGWAELQLREWGDEPGREELSWWVNNAADAVQRTRVPVAVLAVGGGGAVLGGVGLAQYDSAVCRDRSPWVVGTIVRADRRGEGIGQALLAFMDAWAVRANIAQLWVATGGRGIAFYRRCGYEIVETVPTQDGGEATILTKRLLQQTPKRR